MSLVAGVVRSPAESDRSQGRATERARRYIVGGRGGSSRMSSGGSSSQTPALQRVNNQTVTDWVDQQDPGQFLSSAPETITVGGVQFRWFADQTGVDSRGNRTYGNDYQSTQQASNGEWPVIHISVKEQRRRGGARSYVFDKSAVNGTGLR